METSTLIIVLVILILLQSAIIGIYLFRRRALRQKKENIPNYEIVRRTLVKQLHALGIRKPALLLFSARFALEGFREGNPRKIQTSGLRELQYFILETIRARGAQMKIRTAAYLYISYIDRVLTALHDEQIRLEKETGTLGELRESWHEQRSQIDRLVGACRNRIDNFFTDRLPNAESFAEREAVTATPDEKISRAFGSVVVKQSEIRNLSRQVTEQIDEALAILAEWFNNKTGAELVVPGLRSRFEKKAIERLRSLSGARGTSDEDGVPAVVSGLIEVRQLMNEALIQMTGENLTMIDDAVQKYLDKGSSMVEARTNRISTALDAFQKLRNDFNAHQ
jgi:uncharacterized protein YneF (UPF0154 family)